MKRISSVIKSCSHIILSLSLVVGCSNQLNNNSSLSQSRPSNLSAIGSQFLEALQNNNMKSISELYASDAIILDLVTEVENRFNTQPSISLEQLPTLFGDEDSLGQATLKEGASFVATSPKGAETLQSQINVGDTQYYSVLYLQNGKIIFQVVGIADNYPFRDVIQSKINSLYNYQGQPIYLAVLEGLRNAAAQCPPLEAGSGRDDSITDEQSSEYRSCMEDIYIGDDNIFSENGIVNRAVENTNPILSNQSENTVDAWITYLGNAKRDIPSPYMLRYHESTTNNLGFIVYEGVFSTSPDENLTRIANGTESGFPVYNILVIDNNQVIANISDSIYLRTPQ